MNTRPIPPLFRRPLFRLKSYTAFPNTSHGIALAEKRMNHGTRNHLNRCVDVPDQCSFELQRGIALFGRLQSHGLPAGLAMTSSSIVSSSIAGVSKALSPSPS